MADESIEDILARLEGQGAFVTPEPTAPRAVLADGTVASDYGPTGNLILGLSRSALAGPTFGLSKRAEAAIAAPFSERTYGEILADINAQQRAFQGESPILSTATEAGMGFALNPLGALGTLGKTAGAAQGIRAALPTLTSVAGRSEQAADILSGLEKAGRAAETFVEVVPGARLAQQVVSSVPAQAFATGALSADPTISSPVMEGLKTGAIGTAGSVVANRLGAGLGALSREADRLTLSKYGITGTDVAKTLKKGQVAGKDLPEASDVPLLGSVKSLERAGVIDAEADVLSNIRSIGGLQDEIGGELRDVLKSVDQEADAFPDFQDTYTKQFINRLSGEARTKAAAAAKAERQAIRSQFENGGSILDLQQAKTGLNYSWNDRPYTADIQKAVRADLRDEIERRVNAMAAQGRVDDTFAGKVRELNEAWGRAAEVKDVFTRKAGKDLSGDVVESFFNEIRTSGGTGSLNIASAATGSVLPAALGQLANVARTAKGKEWLSDTFSDPLFQKLGAKLGTLLETYGTGKTFATAAQAITQGQKEIETKQEKTLDLELLRKGSPEAATPQITADDYNALKDLLQTAPKAPPAGEPKEKAPTGSAKKQDIALTDDAEIQDLILQESPFVQAIISVESKGNPRAKSGAGAAGLMQLMPGTAKDLGVEDVYEPKQNIRGGKSYINQQVKKYDNKNLALAAYNWGPGNVDRSLRRLEQKGVATTWENLKKYTKIPEETLQYVKRVEDAERQILELGPEYWNKLRNRQVKA